MQALMEEKHFEVKYSLTLTLSQCPCHLSVCRYSFSGLQAVITCYARDVEQTSAIDVVISTENSGS